jgi:hypothetical protein
MSLEMTVGARERRLARNSAVGDQMAMRLAIIALVMGIAAFQSGAAWGGSVEIGFVDEAGLGQWMNGGAADVPSGETVCTPAKFDETSECPTIVISNNSSQAITLTFTSTNGEFSVGMHGGAFGVLGADSLPLPCSLANVNGQLQPGGRCFESVTFWPRTGEVRYSTIHVIARSAAGSTGRYFKVRGTSDYPPELAAAEKVRQRHQEELKKIPKVVGVELDNEDGIKINVTVEDPDDIEAVRRQVPPKIEGYDTEVTQQVEHAYAL